MRKALCLKEAMGGYQKIEEKACGDTGKECCQNAGTRNQPWVEMTGCGIEHGDIATDTGKGEKNRSVYRIFVNRSEIIADQGRCYKCKREPERT